MASDSKWDKLKQANGFSIISKTEPILFLKNVVVKRIVDSASGNMKLNISLGLT